MYCQPPLQSWGTFYLEKKGLMFLRRSTGRFSCGVSASLAWQSRRRAGQPNASTTGKRGVCGLALHLSAQPCSLPARDRRLTCTCAEMRLSCVSEPGSGSCWTSLRVVGLCCCVFPSFNIHCALLSLLLRPRKGKWKSKENTTPFLSPSSASEQQAEREAPQLSSQSGVFFSLSSQEIVLARAHFFTEGNYQRGPAFMD